MTIFGASMKFFIIGFAISFIGCAVESTATYPESTGKSYDGNEMVRPPIENYQSGSRMALFDGSKTGTNDNASVSNTDDTGSPTGTTANPGSKEIISTGSNEGVVNVGNGEQTPKSFSQEWKETTPGAFQRQTGEGTYDTRASNGSIASWKKDESGEWAPTAYGKYFEEKTENGVSETILSSKNFDPTAFSEGKWQKKEWVTKLPESAAAAKTENFAQNVYDPKDKSWYHKVASQTKDGVESTAYGIPENGGGWSQQSKHNPDNGYMPVMIREKNIETNKIIGSRFTVRNPSGGDANDVANGNQGAITAYLKNMRAKEEPKSNNQSMAAIMEYLNGVTTD
jgi:hypothetical protein